MSDTMIEWNHVAKSFEKKGERVEALRDVSLTIKKGEFISILGPSGCGKSTLLNMTAGLMDPDEVGTVLYGGKLVTEVNTKVGYMTQRDTLLPWRTVKGNIELPLTIQKVSKDEREHRVREHIKTVGLTGFENHYPRELSGGMRKRVALGRTLISEPQTLLMDEPFAALDAQLRLVMQEELLRLWSGTGKTVVFVTHDLHEAVALSDRVVVLTGRPGTVKLDIKVPINRPRNIAEIGIEGGIAARLATELWHSLKEEVVAVPSAAD